MNERTNIGYIELESRAVLEISGADKETFLQGMVSNDIKKLEKQDSIFTYLLTPQGKYLFDFFILKNGESFLLDIAKKDKDALLKKFKIYKLRSQVEIIERAELKVFGVLGEPENNGFLFDDTRHENMPKRFLATEVLGLNKLDDEIYHKIRLENMVIEPEIDMEKEQSYPLQHRMIENNAVDFKKGCYVGQEVTARTHHRGELKKKVFKVFVEQGELKFGDEILDERRNVCGKILTSTGRVAMAMLPVEKAAREGDEVAKITTTLGLEIRVS